MSKPPAERAACARKALFGAPPSEGHDRPLPVEADEARSAIVAFLAGFGLDRQAIAAALIERLLEEARAHRRQDPHQDPQRSLAQWAVEHAEQRFEAWLGFVLGPEALDGRSPLMVGRAAFLLCQGPTAWHEHVLVHDDLPQPFVEAMRAAAPPATPVAAPGAMAAQSLESWSVADAAHAATGALGEPLAWASGIRQLRSAPIRLIKFGP